MENYNPNITNTESATIEDEGGITMRDLLSIVVNHWKWFVLSLGVLLMLGTLYVLRITPSYSRQASVLIKEDRNGTRQAMDIASTFSEMGMGMGRVNVNNEILSFQSPDLMLEVVRNLKLDVSYRSKGMFHDYPLYGSSLPVTVSFLSLGFNEGAALTVSPADSNHVILSHFVLGGAKDDSKVIKTAYGETVSTPAGNVIVTRNFTPDILDLTTPIMVTRSGYRSATASCSARLSATLSNKMATVIDLTYKDVNIQRADDVLWMVINVYNENWIKDKNLVSTSTNEFIADRLRIIEKELGSVDQTITSFRSTHRLPNESVINMDMQVSSESSKRLVELNNQMSIARLLKSDIAGAATGTLIPANVGLSDANTQSQITQYNTTMLQRNRLVENSSEENLLVKDMDAQLAALRVTILNSLNNYMRSVDIQIQSTQQMQMTSEGRVSNIPLQSGQILSEERQQKVKESLYLFLLQKREENELSKAFTAYNTRIIASPGGSNSPIAPNKKMILLVAFILGLAIPFAYFYIMEVMNTTVRGRKDLENLSAPFLGELPNIAPPTHFVEELKGRFLKKTNPDTEKREIVVKAHSRNVINEAFRVIRTNLEFVLGKDGGSKVIMVSSFNVGSGKTFISSNLSTALAVKHRRVIAIDLDLRKRSLSSVLPEKAKKGVTDYLSGKTDDYQSLIVKNPTGSGLDILPVGMMPPNPAELLAEPRLAQLLNILRGEYDYIFLDCPPIEIVADADVVAPLADLTIFVVRAGLLERSMVPVIDKYYTSNRYNNLSILLNGTEGAGHYGYKYGYKYGYAYGKYGHYGHYGHYGYGYGYGSNETYYGSSTDEKDQKEA